MLNIVVCGTPGTGKSSLIDKLKPKLPDFTFVNLSKFAVDNGCCDSYDESLETHEINEDNLVAKVVPYLRDNKLNIIEAIHADMLPAELVDWVYICRTSNTVLYDRLKARNYSENKFLNNLEAEIFQSILDEAKEAFQPRILTELESNESSDLDRNASLVEENVRKLMRRTET